MVGANALVNSDFDSNSLIVGLPAVLKNRHKTWWSGNEYEKRIQLVEELKMKMGV